MKNIKDIVLYVGQRFVYKQDPKFLDYWSIMKEKNNYMYGDCDDFALTCIWKICDENIFKFILNVFILHKYRIYFAKTGFTNEKHAIGYAQGLWFDNWTKEALLKEEFLKKTNHKIYFFFPSPFIILPMILGFFINNN